MEKDAASATEKHHHRRNQPDGYWVFYSKGSAGTHNNNIPFLAWTPERIHINTRVEEMRLKKGIRIQPLALYSIHILSYACVWILFMDFLLSMGWCAVHHNTIICHGRNASGRLGCKLWTLRTNTFRSRAHDLYFTPRSHHCG